MSDVHPEKHQGTPPRLVVGAAIVDDVDAPRALLAARRSEPPALAGRWEFPGGKVEPGETPEEALRRELREELDVEIELADEILGPTRFSDVGSDADDSLVWPLGDSPMDGQSFVIRVWLARVTGGTPRPLDGHDEVRWLQPGEWRDVDWVDGDRPIVEAIIAESVRRNRAGWC